METPVNNETIVHNAGNEKASKNLEEILLNGYRRAATSFSAMIGSTVGIENKRLYISNSPAAIRQALNEGENLTLIVTSIIGALKGESYFLLTAEEEHLICDMSRKAFGGGNSITNDLVLKEIDNIISAAVITELSNRLSLRIYGDVPHLFHSSDRVLWNSATRIEEGNDFFIMANANFKFEGHTPVSPSFIWRFDKAVMSLIEKPVVL